MSNSRSRSTSLVALLGIIASLLTTAFLLRSAASVTVQSQFATEGRPITPAGALVMDVTTRQPAVGALPVDFVRSPDHAGRDGGGRYLIAVNSGFGLQFNAAGNRNQQSLSVIDLNARPAPAVIQNIYFPSPQSVTVGLVFSPMAEADGSYALFAAGGFENK